MMMRAGSVVSVLACLGLAAGCSGSSGTSEPQNDKIAGHWQFVSGPMVVGASIDKINYLELTPSGAGTLYTNSLNDGINGCGSVAFAVLSDTTVAFDLPDFPDASNVATQFYQYAQPSADHLTLTDVFGNVTTFQRTASIPNSAICPSSTTASPIVFPANQQPDSRSALGNDTSLVCYTPNATAGAISLNPTNGATGALVSFVSPGQYQYVVALQGSDFWISCWCGSNSSLQRRRNNGTLVSSFDLSAAPINRDINIYAASYDGSNLWVGGYQYSIGKNVILKLNADVSPPTVLSVINFDAPINGLAFKGGELWVLANYVGPVLINVNTTTGVAKATYKLPRGNIYRSLAILGNAFYALRSNNYHYSTSDILPITGL